MLHTHSSMDHPQRIRKLLSLLRRGLVGTVLAGALMFSIAARTGAHAATATYTQAQVISIIEGTFGNGTLANQAIEVATCESSLNPNAYNPSSAAKGLFQIIPSTWAIYGSGDPYNPTDNSRAALKIYQQQGGNSWRPWVCQPSCPSSIQNGSTGSWVATLQYKLNYDYNHHVFPNSPYNFSPPLADDGQFGPLTQAATKDFQTAKHIGVDGIVGPITWRNLGFSC